MAAAAGPTRLLEVCGQRLSRLLHDAKHKHLAWLREAEEQGMRLLDSNFGAEPQLVAKTPSQRRRPRKRQSASLRDDTREPTRRRPDGTSGSTRAECLSLPLMTEVLASLAERYSLAGKRESTMRRSIGRAISKKAAARELSSASSRVSCRSSREVFEEDDVTSGVRPGLELSPDGEKTPENFLAASQRMQAASPPAQRACPPAQHTGSNEGSCGNTTSKPQKENQEQPHSAKLQEKPAHIWYEVVRPLKNFLQAVQRNQLLASPGSTGRGGVLRNFIKRNTPSRPDPKGDFVERERQRLESLRKKQEAEEQRKQKVEEEKRRRQAEMKQKREERLRKALQARERVEQMEEEKKKRMEQKILQTDEKVRPPQVREEKVVEEKSKKKPSKKGEEVGAQKQKALRTEEDAFEQQQLLQKRREDEVKEKGKRVLELKNLVEQRQAEQVKERYKQGEAVDVNNSTEEEESPKELPQLLGQEERGKQAELIAPASNPWLKVEEASLQETQEQTGEERKGKQPELKTAACGTWLSKTVKKSMSTSCLGPPKEYRSPKVSENNYGMDLNSDDSTDDEDDPRKPVPPWADGSQLNQAILHQYYHPVNVDQLFGLIASPKLEDIFGKSKPRYFKRTSSAVWHSPPGSKPACGTSCIFKN
ncbi:inner centromere protein-like [Eudromia elegans]